MIDQAVPRVGIPIPEISQIAFVVEDLEDGMRRFGDLLGIEPWLLFDYEPPRLVDTTYRGEPAPYSMRVALSDVEGPIDRTSAVLSVGTLRQLVGWFVDVRERVGRLVSPGGAPIETDGLSIPNPGLPGVNIELIEPIDGPSTYTEHLGDGPGIHHIGCFAYDRPRAVIERYVDAGIPVIQSGRFDDLEFAYLDMTEVLEGVLLEIPINPWEMPEPDGVFPG